MTIKVIVKAIFFLHQTDFYLPALVLQSVPEPPLLEPPASAASFSPSRCATTDSRSYGSTPQGLNAELGCTAQLGPAPRLPPLMILPTAARANGS